MEKELMEFLQWEKEGDILVEFVDWNMPFIPVVKKHPKGVFALGDNSLQIHPANDADLQTKLHRFVQLCCLIAVECDFIMEEAVPIRTDSYSEPWTSADYSVSSFAEDEVEESDDDKAESDDDDDDAEENDDDVEESVIDDVEESDDDVEENDDDVEESDDLEESEDEVQESVDDDTLSSKTMPIK